MRHELEISSSSSVFHLNIVAEEEAAAEEKDEEFSSWVVEEICFIVPSSRPSK